MKRATGSESKEMYVRQNFRISVKLLSSTNKTIKMLCGRGMLCGRAKMNVDEQGRKI